MKKFLQSFVCGALVGVITYLVIIGLWKIQDKVEELRSIKDDLED